MNELCERTSEWPSTLRVDFIVILPNAQPAYHLNMMKLPEGRRAEETGLSRLNANFHRLRESNMT